MWKPKEQFRACSSNLETLLLLVSESKPWSSLPWATQPAAMWKLTLPVKHVPVIPAPHPAPWAPRALPTQDPSPSCALETAVPWGRASSSASCWGLSYWAGTAGSGSCPRRRAAGWEGSSGSPGNTGAAHLSPAKHDRALNAGDGDRTRGKAPNPIFGHLLLHPVAMYNAVGNPVRETQNIANSDATV